MLRRPPPPNPATYREDCWSEGETSALVDAWGDRYVELDRGYLRQNHWQEVADAVNSYRRAAGSSSRRPPRTGVQCKNRIDTLKKKYKAEKAKVLESGGAYPSRWSFFPRLDALINEPGSGASPSSSKKPSSSSPGMPVGVPLLRGRESPLPHPAAVASRPNLKRPSSAAASATPDSFLRKGLSSVAAAAAAAAAAVEKDEEADSESSRSGSERRRHPMKSRPIREASREENNDGCDGVEEGVRELARAILRFGEIYEKVEIAKQQQMMELENQRLEFAKGLEFQRMQMFIDSQVQLEKIKRSKRTAASSPCPDYM